MRDPRTALQTEVPDGELVEPDVVRQLVADGHDAYAVPARSGSGAVASLRRAASLRSSALNQIRR